jgi:ribosomal protein L28
MKRKSPSKLTPGKEPRRVKMSAAVLKFISENQKLSAFSGRITSRTAKHKVDLDAIAESAARIGAQIPGKSRVMRPRVTHFGLSH